MASNYYNQSLVQRTKLIIIEAIQEYFQTISTIGFPGSTIKVPLIREAYGADIRNYPAIFVKMVHTTPQPLSIGNDFIKDVWSDNQTIFQKYLPGTENFIHPVSYRRHVIAERYGETADIDFQIQIWGDTTPVRTRISDETMFLFKNTMRRYLEKNGIIILRISEGEEADFPLNNTTYIYTSTISLSVNSELYWDIPVGSITAVQVRGNYNQDTNPDNYGIIEE